MVLLLSQVFVSTAKTTSTDDRLVLIREGFRDGLFELVKPEAKAFLRETPKHAAAGEVHMILGSIASAGGRTDEAEKHFTQAGQSPDTTIRGHAAYQLARLQWSLKKYGAAAENFEASLSDIVDPAMAADALLWCGLSWYHAGDFSTSAEFFTRHFNDFDPIQSISARYYRGMSHFKLDRFPEAELDLITVYNLETEPLSRQAAFTLAVMAFQENNDDKADLWASRVQSGDFLKDALYIRARAAYRRGAWSDSYCCFNALVSSESGDDQFRETMGFYKTMCKCRGEYPDNPAWWQYLIEFLIAYPNSEFKGEILNELLTAETLPEGVVDFISRGFEWDPKYSTIISQLYMNAENPDESLTWMIRALVSDEIKELDLTKRLTVARLLQLSGDLQGALEELENLPDETGADDSPITLIIQRANLIFKAGNFERAAALYQQIIVRDAKENPDQSVICSHGILFWLAESYYRQEQWQLAQSVFQRFSDSCENDSKRRTTTLKRLIMCAYHQQDWDRLKTTGEYFIENYPNTDDGPEILFILGLAHANLGEYSQALIILGKALDCNTDSAYVESIKETMREIDRAVESMSPDSGHGNEPVQELHNSSHEQITPAAKSIDEVKFNE